MATSQPQMHLAQQPSSASSNSNEATTSDSGTRVTTRDEPAHKSNAPLTSSPGEVGTPGAQYNSRRQGTGNSQNVTIAEPMSMNRGDSEHVDASGNNGHHGLSEKIHGLRHRANKREQSGHSRQGSNGYQRGHPEPQRSQSTGPRGFVERIATGLSEPRPKFSKEPTWRQSMIAIAKASWLNVLLVFIPVSWALHFAGVSDTVVFVMSFLAIIPLAKLLGFGTEELSLRVGQTVGGLLNATLGNVVELIVAILALVKCELQIVQSSLLGSILSNLLLVLGMCFFAGGLRFSEQSFGDFGGQINSSLLVISVITILIPAGFHAAFNGSITTEVEKADILSMSRGTAVITLTIYIAFMIFQLWSHAHLFVDGTADQAAYRPRKVGKHMMFKEAKSVKRANAAAGLPAAGATGTAAPAYPGAGANGLESGDPEADTVDITEEDEEEEETPSINLWSCVILLLVVAALVGVTAEWLVDSINGLVATGGITEQWVGLILLPIVGNAAEHVTAVTVGYKDKLDLSISVAVGSSIQIALFVIPVLVILGWCLDKPLSLLFDPFESVTLFLSVLLVNYTMQDARSNWMEGYLCMSVYLIIAVAFWYYPSADTPESRLLVC